MPFSKVDYKGINLVEGDLDFIYENIIQMALEEYTIKDQTPFSKNVARFKDNVGSIIDGIIQNVSDSDLVIADLTGLNSNVMYELGVRHSLKRGTIIITQDINSLPSDLRDYLAIEYKYSKEATKEYKQNYNTFKTLLHNAINEVLNTDKYDSPVLKYHKGKIRFRKEDEIKHFKENLIAIDFLLNQFNEMQIYIENMINMNNKNSVNHLHLINILRVKLDNMHNGLMEVNLPPESALLFETFQGAKTLITQILNKFNITEYLGGAFGNAVKTEEAFKHFEANVFNLLEHDIIDTVGSLYEKDNNIVFVKIKDIFTEESAFKTFFLDDMEEFLEKKMKELNVNEEEINGLLVN